MARPNYRVSDQLLQNIVFPGVTCNIYGSTPYYGLAANLSNIGTITADRVIANNLCGGFITGIINNDTTGLLSIGSNAGRGTYTVSSNLTLLGVRAAGGPGPHVEFTNSVIIGHEASYTTQNEANSVVIGKSAGYGVGGGGGNVLIGTEVRYNGLGGGSVIIGAFAASNATNVVRSVIIGPAAARAEALDLADVFIVNNQASPTSNSLLYGQFVTAFGNIGGGYRGRLGVNCIPGAYALDVEGGAGLTATMRVKGNLVASNVALPSDERLKDNIGRIQNALQTTLSLRPVTYVKRDDPANATRMGFIAQEVQSIFPSSVIVADTSGDMLAITYQDFIPLLTGAIQELTERVQTLEARLSQPSS